MALVGVGLQVEELRRAVHVVHVLVARVAQHIGGGRRADGVVLAEHGARVRRGAGELPQVGARQAGRRRAADRGHHGRVTVHQARRGGDRAPGRHVRPGQHQRYRRRLVVHGELAGQAACAERLAVVGGVHDAGVVRQPQPGEGAEHAPDLRVEVAAGGVVGGAQVAQFRLRERLILVEEVAEVGDGGVARPLLWLPLRRQRGGAVAVAPVPRLRPDVGRMGAHEGQEQHPRLGRAGMAAQPLDGVGGVAFVVGQIGGVAGAGGQHTAAGVAARRVVAHAAEQVAEPVHHVQRLDLVAEAVVVGAAAKVQLADRVDGEPCAAQVMAPARHAAVVGDAVVPEADLVHIAAGGQRGALGHADRAVGVSGVEAGAAPRQCIEMRRDAGAAIAAQPGTGVLIGQDEQQIGRSHAATLPYAQANDIRMTRCDRRKQPVVLRGCEENQGLVSCQVLRKTATGPGGAGLTGRRRCSP